MLKYTSIRDQPQTRNVQLVADVSRDQWLELCAVTENEDWYWIRLMIEGEETVQGWVNAAHVEVFNTEALIPAVEGVPPTCGGE